MKKLFVITAFAFFPAFSQAQNQPPKPDVFITKPVPRNNREQVRTFLLPNYVEGHSKSPFRLLPNYVEGRAKARFADSTKSGKKRQKISKITK